MEVEVKETSSVFVVGINEQILFLCYDTLTHSHNFPYHGFHRNQKPVFLPPSSLTQKLCSHKVPNLYIDRPQCIREITELLEFRVSASLRQAQDSYRFLINFQSTRVVG